MSNERLEVLGGLPLFEPLSPDERERLAAGCRMRTFARGAALFREGERADGMHIVLRGVVKVVRFAPDGREMVLHLVRKGNTIGEAAMFQKGTFPASAVAVDDVETLFLPADALFTLVTENPEMVYATFAVLMLSNLLMYPSCVITTRMFSFLLRIPEQLLMGFIAVLCILGSYGSRGNLFDVFVTVFMGIAAYFMRRMEFPLPPLVIGLVLGQQFEMSIGQMMLFKGDDSWLAFVSASPIAMVLLGMAFLLLVVPQVQNYRALRAKR